MLIRVLTIVFALCLTSAAHAQNVWSAPASACVPSHDTIGRYESDIVWVRHLGNQLNDLWFTCQMDRFNSGTNTWNLKLTYRDSTGTGGGATVLARVYSLPVGTATPQLLGTANSNSAATGLFNTVASPNINHTFDFEANSYWVRVLIRRNATSQIAVFYSVVLDGTAF